MIGALLSAILALLIIGMLMQLAKPIAVGVFLIVAGSVVWSLAAAYPDAIVTVLGAGGFALLVWLIITAVLHRDAVVAALHWRTLAANYRRARQTTPEIVFCAWGCVATLGVGAVTFLWKSLI
jgi:hypothetical protein